MPESPVTVRCFGALHSLRRERGLPTIIDVSVPDAGMTGVELAEHLDLPLDMIEGVFCNRTVRPVGWVIRPGDRVAFVPKGTPGPHRVFLGLYAAGRDSESEDT